MAVTTGRPGVFVSESLIPLTTTPVTPGQAVAAFVGTHSAGPVGPARITSWSDFATQYHGFGDGTSMLPYAVYQYFAAGGGQAYIVRAVGADAVAASLVVNGLQVGTPEPVLELTALAPGTCGNDLYITITANAATNNGRFSLLVRDGSTANTPVEQYVDVSLNPADARYLPAMVNASTSQGSKYLRASYVGASTWALAETPATQSNTPLTGGINGVSAPNLVDATKLLDGVNQILNVNLPGVSDPTVINPLIAWAQTRGSRFFVVDSPAAEGAVYDDAVAALTDLSPLGASSGTPLSQSSYGAAYGPWLHFKDPSSSTPGATRLLPPGGSMLGLYAQADDLQGTQQSAAGVAYPVPGALKPETVFTDSDLDTLNQLGINILRPVAGAQGIVPMGARTLTDGMPDRYIAIRRTLMYLTRMAIESTAFAVFRPNNEDLWSQLTSILVDQLAAIQQGGVLRGATQAEAFFVRCDATNNTENSIANGIVNVEIGVALNTPAEYIIIQIGQMASGATSSEVAAAA